MPSEPQPQIYLITPPEYDPPQFEPRLAQVLDQFDIACVRLTQASTDEDSVARHADALREICHGRDVALVIDQHHRMVERLGLDGVHLGDGAKQLREIRKSLGAEAIIGCYCGTSRHNGLSVGEAGADYVAFGPLSVSALGDGITAPLELFGWWSEMIEVPVVAEGGLTLDIIEQLRQQTDFFAIGPEIWSADSPCKALADLLAPLR